MRLFALAGCLCVASLAMAEDRFEPLFNGRDLAGWEGDEQIWSVEEGLLTGQTTSSTNLKHNTFAVWTGGQVDDFELRAEFRLQGDNNSGVQYRSRRKPETSKWTVVGYQADIHPAANYTGMLYEEGGRGIVAERGQKVVLGPEGAKDVSRLSDKLDPIDLAKWNTLEIKAVGNRLIHKINGEVTVDVTDNDPKEAKARGILALQVHAGPPMKVQFKSVELKLLKPAAKSTDEK
jgi:hypothetical protein